MLLLPGMDGGARLLQSFQGELSALLGVQPEVLAYPSDQQLDYADLEALVRARLRSESSEVGRTAERALLIAESFSGPIAIRVAASPPPGLMAVVLVATFARDPTPRALPHLVTSFASAVAFRAPPPLWALRRFLLGGASLREARLVQNAIAAVRPAVLAHRLRSILDVDVTRELSQNRLPTLVITPAQDHLVRHPLRVCLPKGTSEAGSGWFHQRIDGPHLILQRRPTACAALVADFLASLR